MSVQAGERRAVAPVATDQRPSLSERLSAAAALAALAGAVLLIGLQVVLRIGAVFLALAGLLGLVTACWYVVSRRGVIRVIALVTAVAALAALMAGLVLAVVRWWMPVAIAGLALLSVASARHALRRTPRAVRSGRRRGRGRATAGWRGGATAARSAGAGTGSGPAPGASGRHPGTGGPASGGSGRPSPVLIMNLRSGGGKARRFRLEQECAARGIRPVVLHPGDDLVGLAEEAAAAGAPAIGMAGGDGSQAAVAGVAARHGIPFVCVPAGTRNHFALDLGLDRADVLGALDAYEDRIARVIDLAEVNGRTFVNNCSLGLYAKVVQSPQYREAKLRTTAGLLPDLIGPAAVPPDLRFAGPGGTAFRTAHLILVSNNPYQLAHPGGRGTRQHLDTGRLGVVTAQVTDAADARRFMMLEVAGQVARFPGWQEWSADRFVVDSGGPVEIGVDGEALVMQPPLVFLARPAALRVWLPRGAVRLSPAARAVRLLTRSTAADLVAVAAGRDAGQ
ncbi:MAG: diacylglycerol kinase family protein [Actinomycetota bacterium]|nr:diacylglycerol kinase family protein [Actinomycetota bacterium]